MRPTGVEPIFPASEADALSIELRARYDDKSAIIILNYKPCVQKDYKKILSAFSPTRYPIKISHTKSHSIRQKFGRVKSRGKEVNCNFDHYDYFWCPKFKNTDRQYECTRLITGKQVIGHIKQLMKDYKLTAPKDDKNTAQ